MSKITIYKTHLLDLSAGPPNTQGKWQTIHSDQLLRTAVHCLTTQGLLKKAKLSPREVLRTKEDPYKQLGLASTSLTDDDHPGDGEVSGFDSASAGRAR